MKFTAIPALALLPTAALAGAIQKRDAAAGLECSTAFGLPHNNAVKTNIVTVKDNRAETLHVRHTVTITPTVTRRIGGTITVTERITATTTLPPTTSTVTDPTTSTVPTNSNFVPAASAMANAKAKRDAILAARGAAKVAVAVACTTHVAAKNNQARVTVVAKPAITQYAHPITVTRGHQSTRTVERTVRVVTFQATHTHHVPKATAFAACGADNLLGWTYGNGPSNSSNTTSTLQVGINSVALVVGTYAQQFDAASALACCSACQANSNCVGSQWRSGVCAIHISILRNTCPTLAFSFGSFFANPNSPLQVNEGLIVSNGQCGATWKYGALGGN